MNKNIQQARNLFLLQLKIYTTMRIIDKDKIEFSLTNAMLLENEIFNRYAGILELN